MNHRLGCRLGAVLTLALAVCLPGCFRLPVVKVPTMPASPTSPADTKKIDPTGPFPVVKRTIEMIEMKQLYDGYYFPAVLDGHPPKNLDELGIKKDNPKLYEVLNDPAKGVIIFWNVNFNNLPEPAILAYNHDVPTKGGIVLMTNGSVRRMTVDEFNNTPKAGKE
jgi:hypothetical protein